jgi:hypothetical protein
MIINSLKMRKITWIIEQYVYDEYDQKLIEAIKKSGAYVYIYDYNPTESDLEKDLVKRFGKDDIIVFHGGLQLGRKISRLPLYPCTFLTIENYECFRYYGYYGNHLLNSDYLMMGLNDVERNKEFIFNCFNTSNVFIRPSNGYKSFTGQCLSFKTFESDLNTLKQSYGGLDLNQLVVLSSEKEIEEEYRFVVVNNKIVSGTLYLDKDNRDSHRAYYDIMCDDFNALKYAESLIPLYQPDIAFTMDIVGLTSGKYKLIEINSFNCASMYGGNYDSIVKAINDLSYDEFVDIYGI